MAYDPNQLSLMAQTTTGSFRIWAYATTDNFAAVKASGYISDAYAKGVRAGDAIYVIDTDASPPTVTLAAIATCTAAPACTMAQTGVVPST